MNYRDPDKKSDYKLPSKEEILGSIETENKIKSESKNNWIFTIINKSKFVLEIFIILYLLFFLSRILDNLSDISSEIKKIIIENNLVATNLAPIIINDSDGLNHDEIALLANYYGLNLEREINSKIYFDENDINTWHDKQLSLGDLKNQFRLIRLVVDEYENRQIEIKSKEDLYSKIEGINNIIND